jgi:hypothetical protein
MYSRRDFDRRNGFVNVGVQRQSRMKVEMKLVIEFFFGTNIVCAYNLMIVGKKNRSEQ